MLSRPLLGIGFASALLLILLVLAAPYSWGSTPTTEPTPVPSAVPAAQPAEPATPVPPAPTVAPLPTIAPAPTVAPVEAPPTIAPPTPAADRYATLRTSIAAVLEELNGNWSIGVQDLTTGDILLIDADSPHPAASQYKLLLLYQVYRQIEAGALELDQMTRMTQADYSDSIMWDEELQPGDRVSVRGLLRVLVIQSSNAAAHALSRLIGLSTPTDAVAPGARQIGLNQTQFARSAGQTGSTVTSVRDLLQFYTMLYRGELVSKTASQEMLDLLTEQQINDRIPAQLPKGVKVAHKTGNLPGVVNDGGIIFGKRTNVALVILNDGADYEEGTAAIAKVGRLVYDWFN